MSSFFIFIKFYLHKKNSILQGANEYIWFLSQKIEIILYEDKEYIVLFIFYQPKKIERIAPITDL